jgi:hypothetical protein
MARAQQRLAAIEPAKVGPKPRKRVESKPVAEQPPKPKGLGLADLKAAAMKRKAQAV